MIAVNMKNRIMIGVYIIFIIRKLKNPLFLKLSFLLISALSILSIVSIQHIINNTPHDVVSIYHFFLTAFMNTKITVQAMTLLLTTVGMFLLKDLTRYLHNSISYKFATK